MANTIKATPEKLEQFLLTLADTANVTAAAKKVRINRAHMYRLKATDTEFSDAWDEAVQLGTADLEDEAVRRAKDGTLKPVFYKGEKVGTIREYSDTLLIFLLKARDPGKYAERVKQDHTSSDGSMTPKSLVEFYNDPIEAAKVYTDLMKAG